MHGPGRLPRSRVPSVRGAWVPCQPWILRLPDLHPRSVRPSRSEERALATASRPTGGICSAGTRTGADRVAVGVPTAAAGEVDATRPSALRRQGSTVGRAVLAVLPAWLVARVVVAAALVLAHLSVRSVRPHNPTALQRVHDGLLGWDAGWYRSIADHGYAAAGRESLRFFPLFPLLGRWLGHIPGLGTGGALVVVANVASLLAMAAPADPGASRPRRRPVGPPLGVAAGPGPVGLRHGAGLLRRPPAAVRGGGLPRHPRPTGGGGRRQPGWPPVPIRPVGVLLVVPVAFELWSRRRQPDRHPGAGAGERPPWWRRWSGRGPTWSGSATASATSGCPFTVQQQNGHRGQLAAPFDAMWHDALDALGGHHLGSALHIPWIAAVRGPAVRGLAATAPLLRAVRRRRPGGVVEQHQPRLVRAVRPRCVPPGGGGLDLHVPTVGRAGGPGGVGRGHGRLRHASASSASWSPRRRRADPAAVPPGAVGEPLSCRAQGVADAPPSAGRAGTRGRRDGRSARQSHGASAAPESTATDRLRPSPAAGTRRNGPHRMATPHDLRDRTRGHPGATGGRPRGGHRRRTGRPDRRLPARPGRRPGGRGRAGLRARRHQPHRGARRLALRHRRPPVLHQGGPGRGVLARDPARRGLPAAAPHEPHLLRRQVLRLPDQARQRACPTSASSRRCGAGCPSCGCGSGRRRT